MADIVAGDDEIGALLVTAAQNDVGVGMAGVEVVDRHPVELRSEILLHPRHQSPGERFQILIVRAVLRADDEAELVAVVLRPLARKSGVSGKSGAVLYDSV